MMPEEWPSVFLAGSCRNAQQIQGAPSAHGVFAHGRYSVQVEVCPCCPSRLYVRRSDSQVSQVLRPNSMIRFFFESHSV